MLKHAYAYPPEVASDWALVGGPGINHQAQIYRGGPTSDVHSWVAGAYDGVDGVDYCKSGNTTYEICGLEMRSTNASWYNNDAGRWILNLHRYQTRDNSPSGGPCEGDSGSPFFLSRSDGRVGIRGMVSGGMSGSVTYCKQNTNYVLVVPYTGISESAAVTAKTD